MKPHIDNADIKRSGKQKNSLHLWRLSRFLVLILYGLDGGGGVGFTFGLALPPPESTMMRALL